MEQLIIYGDDNIENRLRKELENIKFSKIMLVHGNSYENLSWKEYFEQYDIVHFTAFQVNPKYEDAIKGTKIFKENKCDAIVAVGGGSAIDTAKCIKAFFNMNIDENCLKQKVNDSGIPLIAIPTTAGTGSESTRFAVIYYQGSKFSLTDNSLLPDIAVLDSRVLASLPDYHRKAAMCDALTHAIESYWSVNATEESREYAAVAIGRITDIWKEYIKGNYADDMLLASNYAGRAINISKTTSGHAMSYKITSMFGLAHGHAVIICLPEIWRHMMGRKDELDNILKVIARLMGCHGCEEAIDKLEYMIDSLMFKPDFKPDNCELDELVAAVNPERLGNNPIQFDKEELRNIYQKVFGV